MTLRENFKHLSDADFAALVKAMSGAKHDLFEQARAWGFLNEDGTVNSQEHPAQPGSTVSLFGTGGGQTVPASVAGEITPPGLRPLVNNPQVGIYNGPLTLSLQYAGAAPGLVSGVTQINVTLPVVFPFVEDFPAGTLPLFVQSNGVFGMIATISVSVN